MLHHIVLFKLKPEVSSEKLEEMMRQTRISLLKIDEILSVKCGRNVDPDNQWGFFVAMDVESTEKLAAVQEDAIFIKYVEEVIKANTSSQVALDYETDPGRDIRYS